MRKLRAYAAPSEIEALWKPVFEPYEHGYNAIYADEFDEPTLQSFRTLLVGFQASLESNSLQDKATTEVINALDKELGTKCPH